MNCPELEKIILKIEGGTVSLKVHTLFDAHLKECRTCQAYLNRFHKIGRILEKTVYGESCMDSRLAFLGSLTGRNLRWQTAAEAARLSREKLRRILLVVSAGFLSATVLGVASVFLLGRLGIIGHVKPDKNLIPMAGSAMEAPFYEPAGNGETPPSPAPPGEKPLREVSPEAIYNRLNPGDKIPSRREGTHGEGVDSTRLKVLEAQLSALRDALSRNPRDHSLIKRSMKKYRQVIAERKRLGKPSRVKDYYNLGLLHYMSGEYPQTAVVTAEGIRMVRLGPTQYLHYLKAMSHYQMALKTNTPLPPDSSPGVKARVQGAALRAELDREGRKKSIMELRKAITEFRHILTNPEIESSAREWIIRCNRMIESLGAGD
ncbi:MAG: hypothetical protein U9N45_06790 [Gemmatimonadota bacterium]|nr:hypothetical protein [Gemmatimonadota bacterium]